MTLHQTILKNKVEKFLIFCHNVFNSGQSLYFHLKRVSNMFGYVFKVVCCRLVVCGRRVKQNKRNHILNTPNEVCSCGAFKAALNESPNTVLVSTGSITPSSHNLEKWNKNDTASRHLQTLKIKLRQWMCAVCPPICMLTLSNTENLQRITLIISKLKYAKYKWKYNNHDNLFLMQQCFQKLSSSNALEYASACGKEVKKSHWYNFWWKSKIIVQQKYSLLTFPSECAYSNKWLAVVYLFIINSVTLIKLL